MPTRTPTHARTRADPRTDPCADLRAARSLVLFLVLAAGAGRTPARFLQVVIVLDNRDNAALLARLPGENPACMGIQRMVGW
jgi:hypothetical protein